MLTILTENYGKLTESYGKIKIYYFYWNPSTRLMPMGYKVSVFATTFLSLD